MGAAPKDLLFYYFHNPPEGTGPYLHSGSNAINELGETQVLLSDPNSEDYTSVIPYSSHPLKDLLRDENKRRSLGSSFGISFNSKGFNFGAPNGPNYFHDGPILGDRVTWDTDVPGGNADPNFEYGSGGWLQKAQPGQDGFVRGGWRTSLDRRLIDVKRISKFFSSPPGRAFIAKQMVLQKHNPRKPKFYNMGINTLQQIGLSGLQNVKRGGLLALGGFGQVGEFIASTDYIGDIGRKNWRENDYNLGDPGKQGVEKTLKEKIVDAINPFKKKGLAYNSPLSGTKDLVNALPILKKKATKTDKFEKYSKDYVKFRFEVVDHDKGENNMMVFRAFLDSISDNYSANHNTFKYNGRGEPFYTYKQFDRKLSVGFKIAAQTRWEMKPLYQKLNYLAAQTAPNYSTQGRIRTPYAYITVGDWFNRIPGLITSVSLK